jgi:predicted amidohydrolase
VLTVPSAFTRPTGQAHWEVLLRARAIETGSFVIAPAQGGAHEDGRATWGHSMAVAPWGEVIALADHDEPGVLLADLDLAEVARARAAIPALANARAFAGPIVVDEPAMAPDAGDRRAAE